jgi:hypothetical protein
MDKLNLDDYIELRAFIDRAFSELSAPNAYKHWSYLCELLLDQLNERDQDRLMDLIKRD